MNDPKLAQQIDWFHQFAAQPADQLVLQASTENRTLFERYVIACLPDHALQEGLAGEAFARAVVEIRENERQWNRALMSAIIHADDLHKSDDWQGAFSAMESFAASCPWKLFREVAENQACNYRRG